eukprot:4934185-Amphidinium_carterae.1
MAVLLAISHRASLNFHASAICASITLAHSTSGTPTSGARCTFERTSTRDQKGKQPSLPNPRN